MGKIFIGCVYGLSNYNAAEHLKIPSPFFGSFGTMRSSNPALSDSVFDRMRDFDAERSTSMTVSGSALKSLMLLGIVLIGAAFTWGMTMDQMQNPGSGSALPGILTWGGAIGGFIVALITIFSPKLSPVTAPIYAALQGLFLGGISAVFEEQFSAGQPKLQGIVFQAVTLTLSIAATMFALYGLRIIKVTEKLRAGIIIATVGVMVMYLISFVLSFFMPVTFLHSSSALSIGISGVVIVIAAFNLLLDFDFIERGSEQGMPKWGEWYGAFGLLVTLIWLYIEVLRLLAKLKQR